MTDPDRWKLHAAQAALALVRSGMLVGLGSGSTAAHLIRELGRLLAAGELRGVRGVPTSVATERLADGAGVPLVELPPDGVDLAIDGMDEVTPSLDAIKGLGGALTREKIVAASARRFVLIGDHTKRVAALGARAPVPVEVLAFGWRRTAERLRALGGEPVLRLRAGDPARTDNGHLVLDCRMPAGFDAAAFGPAASDVPGVVGHGLFLGMAERALLAGPDGVEVLTAHSVVHRDQPHEAGDGRAT